jgi:hypothetical protein
VIQGSANYGREVADLHPPQGRPFEVMLDVPCRSSNQTILTPLIGCGTHTYTQAPKLLKGSVGATDPPVTCSAAPPACFSSRIGITSCTGASRSGVDARLLPGQGHDFGADDLTQGMTCMVTQFIVILAASQAIRSAVLYRFVILYCGFLWTATPAQQSTAHLPVSAPHETFLRDSALCHRSQYLQ